MSALTVAEVLDGAADLLEKPGAWAQGTQAMNDDGWDVGRASDLATCWCTVGAVGRVADLSGAGDLIISKALHGVRRVTGASMVTRWNDDANRTQAEVVATLREAAALAREQQA